MGQRTIIIGDIHGMLDELMRLLAALGLTMDDVLVSAGDVVDKGPESAKCVQALRGLREQGYSVVVVKGNHEDKHERFRAAYAKAGDKVKMKGMDELKAITADLSPEDVAFLDTAVIYHAIPEHKAMVVHAGIMPSLESLPTLDEYAGWSKGERSKFDRVLRVRHVTGEAKAKVVVEFQLDGMSDAEIASLSPQEVAEMCSEAAVVKVQMRPKGSFISLGQETEADPFWADVYDGRFGHVYFGHSPYPDAEEPVQFAHATGLDTGAVFGGKLSAVVLEDGQEPRFVSVDASGKFASSYLEE
jgi:serine/threonine protein phosphatase 1